MPAVASPPLFIVSVSVSRPPNDKSHLCSFGILGVGLRFDEPHTFEHVSATEVAALKGDGRISVLSVEQETR